MKIEDFIKSGGKAEIDSAFTILSVPGKSDNYVVKVPTRYVFSKDAKEICMLNQYLCFMYCFFLREKSEEEIAAENAVQKAEEALKAAKSVLEKVKESK